MNRIITFLKNWTLPVSMISGALAYFIGREIPFPAEMTDDIVEVIDIIQPILLFIMLFVSFCKVDPHDMKPKRWHLWLALTQAALFSLCSIVLWLMQGPMGHYELSIFNYQLSVLNSKYAIEGFLLAIICPTATACAVVTQKLGGDSATTTTYTIIINIIVAFLAPALLPLAHPQGGMTFLPAFLTIIKKVFPLLMLPLFSAWAVRYLLPKVHAKIISTKDLAFYLWAVALALAIGITCKALMNSNENLWHVAAIAVATLMACLFQFAFGKWVGSKYRVSDPHTSYRIGGDNVKEPNTTYRIEGGQAMGQKNTVFIIWLGYTFLDPISATAGGFYSVWHNVINSYQLYLRRKGRM